MYSLVSVPDPLYMGEGRVTFQLVRHLQYLKLNKHLVLSEGRGSLYLLIGATF